MRVSLLSIVKNGISFSVLGVSGGNVDPSVSLGNGLLESGTFNRAKMNELSISFMICCFSVSGSLCVFCLACSDICCISLVSRSTLSMGIRAESTKMGGKWWSSAVILV